MEARAAEVEEARGALREAERLAAQAKEEYLRHYHLWWDARQELEQEQRRANGLAKRLRRSSGRRTSPIGLSLPDLPN